MTKIKNKQTRIGISLILTDEEKEIYEKLKIKYSINMSQLCKNLILEYYKKLEK